MVSVNRTDEAQKRLAVVDKLLMFVEKTTSHDLWPLFKAEVNRDIDTLKNKLVRANAENVIKYQQQVQTIESFSRYHKRLKSERDRLITFLGGKNNAT